jgi:DNA-binding CsgD family transcriptional regulator
VPAEKPQEPDPRRRRRQQVRRGRRPDEIAQKLGLSIYLVTQIILTSKNRAKL